MLLDVLIDSLEGSSAGSEPCGRTLLALLPLEGISFVHSPIEREELEGDMLGQASEDTIDPLEVLVTDRSRHVHVYCHRRRVTPLNTGVDVGVLPIDSAEGGGLIQPLGPSDEVLEDLPPIDGVIHHLAEGLTSLSGDRAPLAVPIAPLDRIADGSLHLPGHHLPLFVREISPALVVIHAGHSAFAALSGLHQTGFQQGREVPVRCLALGQVLDELRHLLRTSSSFQVLDVISRNGTARDEATLGEFLLRDEAVDGQVGSNVVDLVGRHPTRGAVLEDKVIDLVLQQSQDFRRVQASTECRVPIEVEIRVLDGHSGRGDPSVPDLGHIPQHLREEGLRQKELDAEVVQIECSRLGISHLTDARDSSIGSLVCHSCLHRVIVPLHR